LIHVDEMGVSMVNCIFCKIAAKEVPSSIVYEDASLLAFKDIQPHAPVHLLIVPRQHISHLSECDASHQETLGKMLVLASKLAKEHGCEVTQNAQGVYRGGYKTLINSGPDGGQEVYHLHMHIIGQGE
jgi:histidine triad (HIT) family protein